MGLKVIFWDFFLGIIMGGGEGWKDGGWVEVEEDGEEDSGRIFI